MFLWKLHCLISDSEDGENILYINFWTAFSSLPSKFYKFFLKLSEETIPSLSKNWSGESWKISIISYLLIIIVNDYNDDLNNDCNDDYNDDWNDDYDDYYDDDYNDDYDDDYNDDYNDDWNDDYNDDYNDDCNDEWYVRQGHSAQQLLVRDKFGK